MRSPRRTVMAVLAALAVGAVAAAQPAAAATTNALWHMAETSGTLAYDSSGNTNTGTLFSVTLGRPGYVGTGFGFNGNSSKVVVQSSSTLNPGTSNFSYTAAVRFSVVPPNLGDTYDVMRKGISTTSGGEYKMEIANVKGVARARCIAKDRKANLARETHRASLADGQWHVITCSLSGSVWSVTVDGVSRTDTVALGSITNSSVLTIGAKKGGHTGGDWYRGDMDEVAISVG